MSRASTPSKTAAPAKNPMPAPVATPAPKMPTIPQDKIAKLAYDKWCKRGCPEGTSVQDWLEAEKELVEPMKTGKK